VIPPGTYDSLTGSQMRDNRHWTEIEADRYARDLNRDGMVIVAIGAVVLAFVVVAFGAMFIRIIAAS
jgi:hypothetical protein